MIRNIRRSKNRGTWLERLLWMKGRLKHVGREDEPAGLFISPPLLLLLLLSTCSLHVGCDGWSLWYLSRSCSIVIGRLGKIRQRWAQQKKHQLCGAQCRINTRCTQSVDMIFKAVFNGECGETLQMAYLLHLELIFILCYWETFLAPVGSKFITEVKHEGLVGCLVDDIFIAY